MLVIHEIKIFIFLSFLSFLNDISSSKKKYYEKCISNIDFHIILLLHHCISVFTILGWLSSNRYRQTHSKFLKQCPITLQRF